MCNCVAISGILSISVVIFKDVILITAALLSAMKPNKYFSPEVYMTSMPPEQSALILGTYSLI